MSEEKKPQYTQSGGVRDINEVIGTAFLGVGFLILLLAYMRAQGRNRKLLEKLALLEK